jgi:hypothetical protein
MFRKIAFGLIATASLAAFAPSAASAHGFGWGGGHWGGHFGGRFYGGPTLIVGGNDCYQQVVVQTHRGPRVRLVNTCVY